MAEFYNYNSCTFCGKPVKHKQASFCDECDIFLVKDSDPVKMDANKPLFQNKTIQERIEYDEELPSTEYQLSEWFMSYADTQRYRQYFLQADLNQDGVIDGSEANRFFSKSKLNRKLLAKIWVLCDQEKKGKLTLPMFHAMFHMVFKIKKSGGKLTVPPSLPDCLKAGFVEKLMLAINGKRVEIKERTIKIPNISKAGSSTASPMEYAIAGYIRQNIQYLLPENTIIPLAIIAICAQYARDFGWVDYSIYNDKICTRVVDKRSMSITMGFREDVKEDEIGGEFVSRIGFNKGVHQWMLKGGQSGFDVIGIMTDKGRRISLSDESFIENDLIVRLNFNFDSFFGKAVFGISVMVDGKFDKYLQKEFDVDEQKNEMYYPYIQLWTRQSQYQVLVEYDFNSKT